MSTGATSEAASASGPGGPQGPVDTSRLILQRPEDLRRSKEDLLQDLKAQVGNAQVTVGISGCEDRFAGCQDRLRARTTRGRDQLGPQLVGWPPSPLLANFRMLAKMLIPGP